MARFLIHIACILFVHAIAQTAIAEEPSPLVEMRDAAEHLADVDPAAQFEHPIHSVRAAIREVVRIEVKRELAERAASGTRGGRSKLPPNAKDRADSGSDFERGVGDKERQLATQAQEARRNSEVSKQRLEARPGNGMIRTAKP